MSTVPLTADLLLAQAQRQGLDRAEAAQLMLHAVGKATHNRAWLLAHGGDALKPDQADAFGRFCARRLDGEPVAYITGFQAFYGLSLAVGPGVLVPRPDTETLVDWALDCLDASVPVKVADWGTGSGAIALALQAQRPQAQVWALERSPVALAQAQANAQRLGLTQVHWVLGDWHAHAHIDPKGSEPQRLTGGLNVIVSNPPYIETHDPHVPALRHEPQEALVSGVDGLVDIRRIIDCAPAWLQPGGWLLLEHGWNQGPAVRDLLERAGWLSVSQRRDLAGHWRCTGAMRP